MKKSNIWTFLVPPFICVAVLIGAFIGRITSGDRIQLEHPKATAPSHEGSVTTTPDDSIKNKVNINTADAATLARLPGIGAVLAARIVEFREENGPFVSVEGLLKVNGIGETKLKNIINYITAGGQR